MNGIGNSKYKSGFEDVRSYGEMRMDATKPEDLRMHITAKKPEMT